MSKKYDFYKHQHMDEVNGQVHWHRRLKNPHLVRRLFIGSLCLKAERMRNGKIERKYFTPYETNLAQIWIYEENRDESKGEQP
ncbi:MAG: hypothetical protein ACM30F_01020 [Nitrospirota bacterium]|nr:hypothetical protein [Nitrospirota bacterium]